MNEVFDLPLRTHVLNISVIIVLFVISTCIIQDRLLTSIMKTFSIIFVCITVIAFIEITFRLICFFGETRTSDEINMDLFTVPQFLWNYKPLSILVIVTGITASMVIAATTFTNPFTYVWQFGPASCILSLCMAFLLLREIHFIHSGPPRPSISSLKGLDYGTGLAYNFYHGYLRLIIPRTGTSNKGLVEKMEVFEDVHNITFASKKLFILVPSSTYIPVDLKEVSYDWIESVSNLEEEVRDRAGTRQRVYRNTVYKIYPNGQRVDTEPFYVVAEGATPLLTYYEVQKHSYPETDIYKKYRKEIAKTFCKKLQEILDNDLECRDLVDVVYYEDYNPDKSRTNVAKVILDRIQKQTK